MAGEGQDRELQGILLAVTVAPTLPHCRGTSKVSGGRRNCVQHSVGLWKEARPISNSLTTFGNEFPLPGLSFPSIVSP